MNKQHIKCTESMQISKKQGNMHETVQYNPIYLSTVQICRVWVHTEQHLYLVSLLFADLLLLIMLRFSFITFFISRCTRRLHLI